MAAAGPRRRGEQPAGRAAAPGCPVPGPAPAYPALQPFPPSPHAPRAAVFPGGGGGGVGGGVAGGGGGGGGGDLGGPARLQAEAPPRLLLRLQQGRPGREGVGERVLLARFVGDDVETVDRVGRAVQVEVEADIE